MDIHIVYGGIGKHIMFTSILPKLTEKVCISAYWGGVYLHHPKVEAIYPDYGWGSYNMSSFFKNFKNIIHVEPYYGEFLKGDIHFIEALHRKLNIPFDNLYHTVTFSEQELLYYSEFIEELGDYVLVQFTGSDRDNNKELNQLGSRNLDLQVAQEVIDILTHDFNIRVIDVNNGQQQFKNTFVPREILQYRDYLIMTKYCQTFIGIDSCLNHMSAFKDSSKVGVALWRDPEYGKLFEYPHNINLYSEIPLQMKFSTQTIVDQLSTLL